MKKNLFNHFISCVLIVLIFFSLTPVNSQAKASSTSIIVENQMKALQEKNLSGGYEPESIFSAVLTGKNVPEVIGSYARFNEKNFTYDSIINIHQYDTNIKSGECYLH